VYHNPSVRAPAPFPLPPFSPTLLLTHDEKIPRPDRDGVGFDRGGAGRGGARDAAGGAFLRTRVGLAPSTLRLRSG